MSENPQVESAQETPVRTGIEGSVLGEEKSEMLITVLKDVHQAEPNKVIDDYLRLEVDARIERGKTEEEREQLKDQWRDAMNIFALPTTYELIRSGQDLEILQESLDSARERKPPNLAERETMAKIYLQVRNRVFPQFASKPTKS